jgi:hypothetical protein
MLYVRPPYQLLNVWASIYETQYAHLGTGAYLNSVVHKSHSSVYLTVCVTPVVARNRLRKNITAAANTHATIEELDFSFSMRFVSYQGVGD